MCLGINYYSLIARVIHRDSHICEKGNDAPTIFWFCVLFDHPNVNITVSIQLWNLQVTNIKRAGSHFVLGSLWLSIFHLIRTGGDLMLPKSD